MKKKNNKKWTLVLVLLLVVSIGYAALASNLKINGSSSVKSATWDVYWNNVQVTQGSVATTQGNQARITDQAKTQVEYSVTLNEPGDFYEFTVDAVNNGTIDAMIAANGIVEGVYSDSNYTQTATLPKAVSYTVTYADGTTIEPKHLLARKNGNIPTTETYKVRIEYKNDDSINPGDLNNTNDLTYYFKFSVNYVQADGTKVEVPHPTSVHYIIRQHEGQITTGDVIGIGDTEDFYVVSSDSEKTVLFAKYNLLVGYRDWFHDELIPSNTPGYGLQSEDATGYRAGWDYAGVMFSTTNYWADTDGNLKNEYNSDSNIYYDSEYDQYYDDNVGHDVRVYVYDSNSEIYQYISGENGYVNRLKLMGAPSTITGRLLTEDEWSIIANYSYYDDDDDDSNNYEYDGWQILHNGTSYWTGSACSPNTISGVYDTYNDTCANHDEPNNAAGVGYAIRPVIEIPTSALQ